jgi:ribosomal protein L11 methyltransferase
LLAIVASRCGAARVLAVDLDAEAVHVASDAIAANALGARVEVRVGSLGARAGETFDGIVANIQSSFFLSHAAEVAAALTDRGVLIASGFLDEDVEEIAASLAAAGLTVEAMESDGPWVCLASRRTGA